MKQLLLICAVVALVGCGESKEEKAAKSKAAAEAKAAVEAKAAAEAKLIKDPIVEAAIRSRWSLNKPTGELTEVDLEKVTELYFYGNKLTEVPKELEKLTQLWLLILNDNQLTDVKGLEKLTQLTGLGLDGNQLTESPTGLEKLTKLTSLSLSSNKLTDVKGLEKLTQLEVLMLQDNPDLTKAQIAELQKALPKCKISSDHD